MSSRDRTKLDAIKRSSEPLELFLDDGGVLNDKSLRGPEWLRLIGEFMPGRLGGTADKWARANRVAFPHVWESIQQLLPGFATHREFLQGYATSWMSAMCAHVGVAPPPDDDAVALHNELSCYVWERTDSAIAGSAKAVLALHRAGYTLYTASGGASWELRVHHVEDGHCRDVFGPVRTGPCGPREVRPRVLQEGIRPRRASPQARLSSSTATGNAAGGHPRPAHTPSGSTRRVAVTRLRWRRWSVRWSESEVQAVPPTRCPTAA